MAPFFVARAENSELWDVEGRRYIDFAGGIAVLNTGHRHPKVVAAVKAQLDAFTHSAYQVVPYEAYVALAERLNAAHPRRVPQEDDLLLHGRRGHRERGEDRSRRHGPQRRHRLQRRLPRAHDDGHGAHRQGGAVQGGLRAVPARGLPRALPDGAARRQRGGLAPGLSYLFKADIEPKRVAAILIEPVQGEGGFYVAPPELMRGAAAPV